MDSSCGYDYLEIEGPATTTRKICGQQFSNPLITFNDTSFNITFSSDDEGVHNGFVFSVVLDKPCTVDTPTMLTADTNVKSFNSIYYPNNYTWNRQTGNYTCEWHIEASDGIAGILLYLDLGGLSSGTTLNVYQGCDNNGVKLYPPSDVDPDVATPPVQREVGTGNSTFVEFSVGSAGGLGFQIQYLSVAATDNSAACTASASSPATLEANDTLQYLTSSNFPDVYPSSLECHWNITDGGTNRGVILTVEFNHFATSCQDYLMISGGSDTTGTKVCSDNFNTSAMVFKNTSFQLMFNSDEFSNASGFVLSYILDAPCKGAVTMIKPELPIMTISSPGYPSFYPGVGRSGGYVCKWHIEAETNDTGILIKYAFDALQAGDNLALYEGCDNSGVQKSIPNNDIRFRRNGNSGVLSFIGSAYIEFTVTSSTGDSGLQMFMTAQKPSDNTEACSSNGTVVVATKDVQYFTSADFPNQYKKNDKCKWYISGGNSGETVILTIEFYDIEHDSSCGYDYLEIEGPATTTRKICGQQFSNPLITFNDTSFNITFSSDDEGVHNGFVFSVVLDKPCTVDTPTMLTADTNVKSFNSIYYPNNYTWNRQTGNYTCEWHIEANDGIAGILLYLDLGGLSSGTTLNVYQGCDNNGVKLYPPSDVDPDVATPPVQREVGTGNSTFVEFSVGSAGGLGFQIQYLSVAATDNSAACTASASSPATLEANDTLQYLTSSNFPDVYPSSLECHWNITDGGTNRGVILTVEFNHFATSCQDYLMISGGSDTTGTKVCSDNFNTSAMVFNNTSFQLMFNSDEFSNASGFVLSYILDAPCKGAVTMIKPELPIMTISSPGYPSFYPGVGRSGGYVCKWHIEAETNDTGILIKYAFDALQAGDNLAMYEGCDNSGVQKSIPNNDIRFRRNGNSGVLSFIGSAYIEFNVTSSTGDSGLQMFMTAQKPSDNTEACSSSGTVVVATKDVQYFTSTDFPNQYKKNEDCKWYITGGNSGETVILTIEFYDIERDSSCGYDYLKIEGPATKTETICGQQFSNPLITFNDTSFNITFSSDDEGVHNGFVFSVVLDKPCTADTPTMLTADINVKSFNSIYYPDSYTWNRQTGNYKCEWHIEAGDGAAGILLDVDMGGLSIGTHLNIHEGCGNTGTRLYPAANAQVTTAERIQIATGNSTFIEFIVGSAGGQGFQIKYLSITATDNSVACSGIAVGKLNATDSLQYITSSDFPQLYPRDLSCKWEINDGASGRGVFLNLLLYHIECANDKLDLTDGDGTTTTKCSDELILSPENFTSSSFVLDFLSNAAVQKHGFVLSYILGPPCTGNEIRLVASENIQEFSSPLYPVNYPSAIPIGPYICIWRIESSDNVAKILLTVEIQNLTDGNTLEILEGSLGVTRLTSPLETGVSPGMSAVVRFSVTTSGSSGFIIKYMEQRPIDTTQACSASNLQITATSSPGYLTSPNFPDLYPNNQQCTWNIDDGGTHRGVILQLLLYEIQNSTNCQKDELAIRAGPTKDETKVCFDTLVTTTQNFTDSSFEIYFKTDSTVTKHGFQLRHIVGAPCNDSVIELNSVSELKQFVSPEYPAYPGSLYTGPYTCYFVITPQNGADGNLMSLNLSGIDAADNIVIYDGRNSSGIKLFPSNRKKRSTGITNQVLVRNSGSSAFIEFTVNSPMGSTGFVVDYVSHPVTNNTGACSTSTTQLVATSTIQYITSTNFPAIYRSDQNCTWHISNANSGINVLFTLITYQIQEQGSSCDGDRLNIQQGPGRTPNIRCSNALSLTPEVFKSSSFDIEFLSDNTTTTNEHGFLFSYILDIPCKGGPTQLSADITLRNFSSPEYPNYYPSTAFIGNYTCEWVIQAQEPGAGILLLLTIDGLNAGDTVLVYSGTNDTGTRLYPTTINLQANTSASTFHFAPGSSAFVSFTATTTANMGFNALYMAIKPSNTSVACSNNGLQPLVATTGVQYITSPSFPDIYTSGLSCRWTISTGGVNADVIMTVTVLHTESDVCSNDTLVVKGAGASAKILCSEQVSTTAIEYHYRNFDIQFITNNGDNNRGFVISYILGPEKNKYIWSEMLAIAIAASVGPAVLFLVLAIVIIAYLKRNMTVRKHQSPTSLRSYTNGGFINSRASANGLTNGDLHIVKTEQETAPPWIKMFRSPSPSPYSRYDRPHSK
ncbi:cubilin-like [Pecten maximus]|uniref:cubilin-like n=1 Tax=Pecten maximus TaxID=6579 RepID=UPI00145913FE|nr:cubilin-like [Pecten maximus]